MRELAQTQDGESISLGDYVRDGISGFEGYVTIIGEHLTGCTRIQLSGGKFEDNGRTGEKDFYYPDQLTVLDGQFGVSHDPITSTDFHLGQSVRDEISGFEGVVVVINYDLFNCPQCLVQPIDHTNTTECGEKEWFDAPRLEATDKQSFVDEFAELTSTDDTASTGAIEDKGERNHRPLRFLCPKSHSRLYDSVVPMPITRQRVQRFPKVQSPFERSENEEGHYTLDDEINDGFEWVFESDDVVAVEKLHGTNCAVDVTTTEQGIEIEPWTRHGDGPMNRVNAYDTRPTFHDLSRAFQNSLRRGYLDDLDEGVHYGEVVGPDFHGNEHDLDENLFISFEWLMDKCAYKSWGDYPKTLDSIRDWFSTDLFSLFYARMHGTNLDTASVRNGTFCEGVIFVDMSVENPYSTTLPTEEHHLSNGNYRKAAPHLAKLRRDMFDGYASGDWPASHNTDHLQR